MTQWIRTQWLVRFAYHGERFSGLQPQPGFITAGGNLRLRLEEAAGQKARGLNFTARTDAGVHALCNYATCYFYGELDNEAAIARACAPRAAGFDDGLYDVQIKIVDKSVHARNISYGKRYRYVIEDGCPPCSEDNLHVWQISPKIDVQKLREACAYLLGTHDFTSFRTARCSASTAVKTLSKVDVSGPFAGTTAEQQRYVIEFEGDAFVRHMIRNLVGTLAEMAVGLRAPSDMPMILQQQNRQAAGLRAPARGLTLVDVLTHQDFGFRSAT